MEDEEEMKKLFYVSISEMKEEYRIKEFNMVLGKYSEALIIVVELKILYI